MPCKPSKLLRISRCWAYKKIRAAVEGVVASAAEHGIGALAAIERVGPGFALEDVSAIAAASVVMEHVVAFEIARAFLEKFSGDSMTQVKASHAAFMELARRLPLA